MKRVCITILLCSLLGIASCSKKPDSPSLPTADQVLATYVKALGGQDAIARVNSRLTKGSIEMRGATGKVENYAKSPSKYMSVTMTPEGTLKEGFDGAAGWGIDPAGHTRDWTADEIALSTRTRNLHRDIELKSLYTNIAVVGQEAVEGRPAYIVELTPKAGKAERMFFDAQTGLLVEHEYEVVGPQGPRPFMYLYDNYKEVDGVKLPFTIKRVKPTGYTVKIDEVQNNIAINDDQFKRPLNP
jgi:outer membrane lipoprotein-sorting protein